ncbi:VCBS repeat-containing protein [Tropicibacter oceani]|uniref:VCBS repeat-containing protein n=1 Tax=Tropicibacter oceani TaxID=3058420 RepID=A0ABY8QE55_9RHOB|nr:VCBS repeat-containing protein [Tropicibacter oceani]WGW02283.1 VCBS repeat-containing protein [Tropicibacter oceani]
MGRAPRLLSRLCSGFTRGARLASCLWLAAAAPAAAAPPNLILDARYDEPTGRYAHGVLGDAVEWGALRLRVDFCRDCESADIRNVVIRLPQTRVFEDIAPRLVNLEGQGNTAVMVVESDLEQGARLALYNEAGLMAATPFIGRANRWLAPIGSGDLVGDGQIELAYIDRPHLAKTLRVWRYENGALREVAAAQGFTNHRIGWSYIAGGIRDCGDGLEMIVADGDWKQVMSVRFDPALKAQTLGAYSASNMRRAMECGR